MILRCIYGQRRNRAIKPVCAGVKVKVHALTFASQEGRSHLFTCSTRTSQRLLSGTNYCPVSRSRLQVIFQTEENFPLYVSPLHLIQFLCIITYSHFFLSSYCLIQSHLQLLACSPTKPFPCLMSVITGFFICLQQNSQQTADIVQRGTC